MEIANLIPIVSVVVSLVAVVVTFMIYRLTQKSAKEMYLYDRLRELQMLVMKYPYLEDENFTKRWNTLKKKIKNNTITDDEREKFLRYDSYTEMLFNYVVFVFEYYKTEEKVLNFVAFKEWIRPHKLCWDNPIIPHSNRDTYGERICDIVDKWIK